MSKTELIAKTRRLSVFNFFLLTGGGLPGVLFYHGFILFFIYFFIFIKFIFELQQLFFQIRIKKSRDVLPLFFQNCCSLPRRKKKSCFFGTFFKFSVKTNKY